MHERQKNRLNKLIKFVFFSGKYIHFRLWSIFSVLKPKDKLVQLKPFCDNHRTSRVYEWQHKSHTKNTPFFLGSSSISMIPSTEVEVTPFTHHLFTRILPREREPNQSVLKKFDPPKDVIPWTDTIEQNKAVDYVLEDLDTLTDLRRRKGLPLIFPKPLSNHRSFSLWYKVGRGNPERLTSL